MLVFGNYFRFLEKDIVYNSSANIHKVYLFEISQKLVFANNWIIIYVNEKLDIPLERLPYLVGFPQSQGNWILPSVVIQMLVVYKIMVFMCRHMILNAMILTSLVEVTKRLYELRNNDLLEVTRPKRRSKLKVRKPRPFKKTKINLITVNAIQPYSHYASFT
ncbi:hypothetical protein BD770DRAFT_416731 [Pilaira anomala]|nr:hypothetical protein BD770DRAFT_416731 [Pilaira anomala]